MERKRILVIGLDGATLQVISPLVSEGKLPAFERLMKDGSFGVLDSVIRPGSPQAWSSFITGKNPGKHGVFSFIEKVPDSYDVTFVNALSRAGESLWSTMSRHGLRVGVMNVPITYPPEEVNGVFISGLDAPGVESQFTYPPDLFKEIRENVGEYLLEAGMWGYIAGGRYSEGFARLGYVIDQRFKVAKYLYEKEPWDFFMVVFTAPDRVQHNFWKFMDPTHPLYTEESNRKHGNAIEDVYIRLDEKIGKFLEMADENTVTMLMSDHGMGKNTDKAFYLNKFLEDRGFLTFKDRSENLLVSRVKKVVFVDGLKFMRRQISKRFQRKTKERFVRLFPKLGDKIRSLHLFSRIDMAKTKVYADEGRSVLWVNLKGRDPQGTVEADEYNDTVNQVIEAFERLKDPETGEAIIERAFRREEIYHGKFVRDAPDIILMWHRDEYRSRPSYTTTRKAFMRKMERDELEKLEFDLQSNADHRMDGIFFIDGPGIKKNHETNCANIMDLAPTILYLAGLPIPEDMDGKVLEEVFEDELLQEHPIRFSKEGSRDKGRGSHQYSDQEADAIQERLEGLGYL
jgi:predicted AlkP superfamily phosphohydrolase/phosphomutase